MANKVTVFILALGLVGCASTSSAKPQETIASSPAEENVYFDYVSTFEMPEDNTMTGTVQGDLVYDISDPRILREQATNVFLGVLNSKDYATCNVEGMEYSAIPYTVGTIEVLQNFVGETKEEIAYYREGGTVTVEEFLKNAPKERVEKINSLMEESGRVTYVHSVMLGDIEPEAGQVYLFYASYEEAFDRYMIIGFEYGTREVIGDKEDQKIKDNTTGTYSSFTDYVNAYLK